MTIKNLHDRPRALTAETDLGLRRGQGFFLLLRRRGPHRHNPILRTRPAGGGEPASSPQLFCRLAEEGSEMGEADEGR